MKSLFLAAALGAGAIGLVGLTPAKADASWLSEALHRRFDPAYYGGYYAPPVYGDYGSYYAPYDYGYYAPDYVAPPAVYYSTPYYYSPGVSSFYWYSGPSYYGHWGGYRGGWRGGHGWHGEHWHHHR